MDLEKRLSVIKERLDLASSVDYNLFDENEKKVLGENLGKVKAFLELSLAELNQSVRIQVRSIDENIEKIYSKL